MKRIYFFILVNSPACKRTQKRLIDIMEKIPQFREIPIEIIDVLENPLIVEQLQITKFPTFWNKKGIISEGERNKNQIHQMLENICDSENC